MISFLRRASAPAWRFLGTTASGAFPDEPVLRATPDPTPAPAAAHHGPVAPAGPERGDGAVDRALDAAARLGLGYPAPAPDEGDRRLPDAKAWSAVTRSPDLTMLAELTAQLNDPWAAAAFLFGGGR